MLKTCKLAREAKEIIFKAQDAAEQIDDERMRKIALTKLGKIRGELEQLDNEFVAASIRSGR